VWLKCKFVAINFRHLNEWDFSRWYFGCPHSRARLLLWKVLYCDIFRVYVLRYAENPDWLETCDIICISSSGWTRHFTFHCSVSPINQWSRDLSICWEHFASLTFKKESDSAPAGLLSLSVVEQEKNSDWVNDGQWEQQVEWEQKRGSIRKIHLLNSNFLLITNVISVVYHITIFVPMFVLLWIMILGGILSSF